MKRTIVVAAIGLATIMVGCEGTDPVISPETSQSVEFDKANCSAEIPLDQIIPLDLMAPTPTPSSELGAVDGNVIYGVGPSPVLLRDMVSVSLQFNATLTSLEGTNQTWVFSGSSTDQISLTVSDPTLLIKEYRTPGITAQSPVVTLFVKYTVTECEVKVHSMWAVEGGIRTSSGF
jgi:hypothetical protein